MTNIFIYSISFLLYLIPGMKLDFLESNNSNDHIMSNPIIQETNSSVTEVSVSGQEYDYTFNVGIKSPDTGCKQYADWWEIVSEDGELIYRRILLHSHVGEQPFTRSGGSVNINKDQTVFIRSHMNNKGYGEVVFKGSVSKGFKRYVLTSEFANELQTISPLPKGCRF
ncbi:hypothetical protein U0D62_10840 [Aquimarina sp. 2201CG5-10]|nr:hypothetical protein [Aquimarina sp. 2201CG5-10]